MGSFIYRDHRGHQIESLKTMQVMYSFEELEKYIHNTYNKNGNVEINFYGNISCVLWADNLVTLDGCAVGFTNGIVIKNDILNIENKNK